MHVLFLLVTVWGATPQTSRKKMSIDEIADSLWQRIEASAVNDVPANHTIEGLEISRKDILPPHTSMTRCVPANRRCFKRVSGAINYIFDEDPENMNLPNSALIPRIREILHDKNVSKRQIIKDLSRLRKGQETRRSVRGAIREVLDEDEANIDLGYTALLPKLRERLPHHDFANAESTRIQIHIVKRERRMTAAPKHRKVVDVAKELLMEGSNRCLSNLVLGGMLEVRLVDAGRSPPTYSSLTDHIVKARRALSDETGEDWSFAFCSSGRQIF